MSNPQRVIRQTFRWMYLSGIGIFCNPAPGIHILNCHRIKDNESPEQFKKVLQHLATKARLVKIEDAIELIESKQNVLEPIIAFTFDDGFMECYTHLLQYWRNSALMACSLSIQIMQVEMMHTLRISTITLL